MTESCKIGRARVKMSPHPETGLPVVEVFTGIGFERLLTVGVGGPINVPNLVDRLQRAIADAILCDRGLQQNKKRLRIPRAVQCLAACEGVEFIGDDSRGAVRELLESGTSAVGDLRWCHRWPGADAFWAAAGRFRLDG